MCVCVRARVHSVRRGVVLCGVVLRCVALRGVAWCGVVWCGLGWGWGERLVWCCGVARHSTHRVQRHLPRHAAVTTRCTWCCTESRWSPQLTAGPTSGTRLRGSESAKSEVRGSWDLRSLTRPCRHNGTLQRGSSDLRNAAARLRRPASELRKAATPTRRNTQGMLQRGSSDLRNAAAQSSANVQGRQRKRQKNRCAAYVHK